MNGLARVSQGIIAVVCCATVLSAWGMGPPPMEPPPHVGQTGPEKAHHVRLKGSHVTPLLLQMADGMRQTCQMLGLTLEVPPTSEPEQWFHVVEDYYYSAHKETVYKQVRSVGWTPDCQLKWTVRKEVTVQGHRASCTVDKDDRVAVGECRAKDFGNTPNPHLDWRPVPSGTSESIQGLRCQVYRSQDQPGPPARLGFGGQGNMCVHQPNTPWVYSTVYTQLRGVLLRSTLREPSGNLDIDMVADEVHLNLGVAMPVVMPQLAPGMRLQ
jgi:hypothetical protein